MNIAITGGTGFVGRTLASQLLAEGHKITLTARGVDRREPVASCAKMIEGSVSDRDSLLKAFRGCEAVAHCAGINREIGKQTYQAVHLDGTRNVVWAAREVGVKRIVLLSFLRARPNCNSGYHESKFAAEKIVRDSGLEYTILKAGVSYGKGDHLLDHVSHSLHTFPVFLSVGLREQPCAPLAVEDLVQILRAALIDGRLANQTLAAIGPEAMTLSHAVRRIAKVLGKRPLFLPSPVWLHVAMAAVFERTMAAPLESFAQVRILSESLVEPAGEVQALPTELVPKTGFTEEQIRKGLPEKGGFGLKDCLRRARAPG